ncbi:MAG: rRNA maturation RNase YbeY [Candidatus Hydrogenedentes bacterium]|nr:rRNA maturation RNase YbeY [Candidatus Hydrogenedentota bacterium]
MVHLHVQNQSTRKRLYQRGQLLALAGRICAGERVRQEVELSVLFCDDDFIRQLNKTYRKKDKATDVLSFAQEQEDMPGVRILGDVVISLETVERNCGGNAVQMREEVRLLFCHGMLHLLGHDHVTMQEQKRMTEKQAQYLGVPKQAAWRHGHTGNRSVGRRTAVKKG